MKSQVVDSLITSAAGSKNDNSWQALFSMMVSNGNASDPLSQVMPGISPVGSIKGISATGRNMALADPESAYKMMTVINNVDVRCKAEFSELSQMKTGVAQMKDAGVSLSATPLSAGNDSIKLRVLGFVGQYNAWIGRFSSDLQPGGLLAGTQAAEVSQYELEQNVNNRFCGANDGMHGMNDLGVSIDPYTHLASVETARLDAKLADNKDGVVDTLQEFGTNIAKSASMLVSDGNFIQKQLDNLSHAIHFIFDNKSSLQQEFGAGDAAKPAGQVAAGLAAYNQSA
jgi:hypothetical protein